MPELERDLLQEVSVLKRGDRMNGLCAILVLSVIVCPLSFLFIMIAAIINYINRSHHGIGELITAMTGVILIVIGYRLHVTPTHLVIGQYLLNSIILKRFPFDKTEFFRLWLISDTITLGAAVIIEQISLLLLFLTPDRIMMAEEKRKEKKKLRPQKINYDPGRSQVIFGVSGAGKTAYIARSLEEIVRNHIHKTKDCQSMDAVIYIVDGKGSVERFSLFYSCKIICDKYSIPFTLINGTANKNLNGVVYDFLDEVKTADEMKDFIMTLNDDPLVQTSSNSMHYKTLTERYLIEILETMIKFSIDITLNNVLTLMEPDSLFSALADAGAQQYEINMKNEFVTVMWPEVRDNAEKLRMFIKGEGAEIFTGDGERSNMRKAYEKGGIVLVLADELSRQKLAGRLVQVVTQDLRLLVSERLTGERDMDKKVYVFYDEFSSYIDSIPRIRTLFAKCRSSGTVMSLATQSCADIIGIDPAWFDILCNTVDRFVIFRQHAASAETAAVIFGTEAHVTQTSRSSNMEATGESSNTSDRSYVLHPDIIRNLPANVGILLDKTEKPDRQVKCFRNKFVEPGKGNRPF